MDFKFAHNNINVFDLEGSLSFYREALGLEEKDRIEDEKGDFVIVYLGDGQTGHRLELTWLREMDRPYRLGDNEVHMAFTTTDYDLALEKHRQMGCVCFENPDMGIYFIEDPDGYWTEIMPENWKAE